MAYEEIDRENQLSVCSWGTVLVAGMKNFS